MCTAYRCRNSQYGGLDFHEMSRILCEDKQYSDLHHPSQEGFFASLPINTKDSTDLEHNNCSSILPCLGKPIQIRTKPGVSIRFKHWKADIHPCFERTLYFFIQIWHMVVPQIILRLFAKCYISDSKLSMVRSRSACI